MSTFRKSRGATSANRRRTKKSRSAKNQRHTRTNFSPVFSWPVEFISSFATASNFNRYLASAIGLALCVGTLYALLTLPLPASVRWSLIAIVVVGRGLVKDRCFRHQIRQEVDSFDGRVKKISWMPFFNPGWLSNDWRYQNRFYTFYKVHYVNRDGEDRTERCGMSFLLGSDWQQLRS